MRRLLSVGSSRSLRPVTRPLAIKVLHYTDNDEATRLTISNQDICADQTPQPAICALLLEPWVHEPHEGLALPLGPRGRDILHGLGPHKTPPEGKLHDPGPALVTLVTASIRVLAEEAVEKGSLVLVLRHCPGEVVEGGQLGRGGEALDVWAGAGSSAGQDEMGDGDTVGGAIESEQLGDAATHGEAQGGHPAEIERGEEEGDVVSPEGDGGGDGARGETDAGGVGKDDGAGVGEGREQEGVPVVQGAPERTVSMYPRTTSTCAGRVRNT